MTTIIRNETKQNKTCPFNFEPYLLDHLLDQAYRLDLHCILYTGGLKINSILNVLCSTRFNGLTYALYVYKFKKTLSNI